MVSLYQFLLKWIVIYFGKRAKRIAPDIYSRARAKLHALDITDNLDDLRPPLSNHLEKLTGDTRLST